MHNVITKRDSSLPQKLTTFLPLCPMHGALWLRLWGTMDQSINN